MTSVSSSASLWDAYRETGISENLFRGLDTPRALLGLLEHTGLALVIKHVSFDTQQPLRIPLEYQLRVVILQIRDHPRCCRSWHKQRRV